MSFICTCVAELLPLTDVRILFPLNILRIIDRILPNFVCAFKLIRSRLGLLPVNFHLYSRILALESHANFRFSSIS